MKYWIWLQSALGYDNKRAKIIIEKFENAQKIYNSSYTSLKESGLFSSNELSKLNNKDLEETNKILDYCNKNNIQILPITDNKYPNLLKEIDTPPIVLYARGDIELLNDFPLVCIVGPREVSSYGQRAAFSLAARLSKGGFVIVSGGALGSDSAAHKGALKVDGKTICVLGCGIDSSYLTKNKPLRDEISQKGLIISEYPPKTPATKYSFPVRNRIMSGLSLCTVLVEAGEGSGALITANLANEQGRDVFVIPGNPSLPEYKQSNILIRDGARPLLEAKDIFDEYSHIFPDKINFERVVSQKITLNDEKNIDKEPKTQIKVQENEKIKKKLKHNLSKNAEIVYNCLDKEKFFLDEIATDDMTDSQLLAAITELEIYGYIIALPGGRYSLN